MTEASKGLIDDPTDALKQFFLDPLILSPQVGGGQNQANKNLIISRLIFGDPARGSRTIDNVISELSDLDSDTLQTPIIILGPSNQAFNIFNGWEDINAGNIGLITANEAETETNLSLIFVMSQAFGPAARDTNGLQVFFNSIPTVQMSMCQPFLTLQLISDRTNPSEGDPAAGASIYKFLHGATGLNDEPNFVKMLAGTGISASGEPGNISENEGGAGMELFLSPQTMVPDSDYANHDSNLRATPIIDRFRPFMSLNDFTISSYNAGAGALSYKTARMSITLHDRSRMTEIAEILNPGQYQSAKFICEWGWSHPHGQPGCAIENPYGRFLNSLRRKELFRVTKYKLNMDTVGQFKIEIDLHSPAGLDLQNQKISAAPNGMGTDNIVHQLNELITRIGEALGILRSKQQLTNISGYRVLGRMGTLTSVPRLTDKIGDGDKTVGDMLGEIIESLTTTKEEGEDAQCRETAGELIADIGKLYSLDDSSDSDTMIDDAYRTVANAIERKMVSITGGPTGGDGAVRAATSDPFKNLTKNWNSLKNDSDPEFPDEEYNSPAPSFVSLAKVFAVFIGQSLQATSPYTDIQMIFHNFNDQAGLMGMTKADGGLPAKNIGEFKIHAGNFRSMLTHAFQRNRSLEMDLTGFISLVINNFPDDMSSINYGLQGLYQTVQDPETGRITAEKTEEAKENDALQMRDAVAARLRTHCVYTEFRMPQLEVTVESQPVWHVDGGEDEIIKNEILKIHVYDKQASNNPAAQNTLRSAYNAFNSGNVNQEPTDISAEEGTPATDGAPTTEAAGAGEGLAPLGGDIDPIALFRAVRSAVPTITYGSSASMIKNASLSTEADQLFAANIMTAGGPNPGPLMPTGLGSGELPLEVFPTRLTLGLVGCPLIEYMQQFFVDFGTGTSADNMYHAIKVNHKISPGTFETSIVCSFVDAYGTFRTHASGLSAINAANEANKDS